MTTFSPILFFDGECGLCSRVVSIVRRFDSKGTFRFAPLQGSTAQRELPLQLTTELETMVLLVAPGDFKVRSDAALAVASTLGGVFALFTVFRIFPKSWREFGYRVIARNRRKIFGARVCELPQNPAERALYLP